MTGRSDADSPLPVSSDADSSSPTETPVATTFILTGQEEQTAAATSALDDSESGDVDIAGTEEANMSSEELARSPSIMSDYSKPDPPCSVHQDEEQVPRCMKAFDSTNDDDSTDTIPLETDHHSNTISINNNHGGGKLQLDFINVPSRSQEEQEDVSVMEEANIAQVLTDMRDTQQQQQSDTVASTITSADYEELYSSAKETKEDAMLGQSVNAPVVPNLDKNSNSNYTTPSAAEEVMDTATPLVYNAPRSISSPHSQQQQQQQSPFYLHKPDEQRQGPDDLPLMPRVDAYQARLSRPPQQQGQQHQHQQQVYIHPVSELQHHQSSFRYPPLPAPVPNGGRRKIRLRLQEDIRSQQQRKRAGSFLGHIRRRSSRIMFGSGGGNSPLQETVPEMNSVEFTVTDRGNLSVSWFEGTSSLELQEHVRRSIARKLKLGTNIELTDIRVIDESVDPPEEIVLSPYIPDGAHFLLRFSTKDINNDGTATPGSQYSRSSSHNHAPISPSAAPSPHPHSEIAGLNANQLALLRNQLNALRIPVQKTPGEVIQQRASAKHDAAIKSIRKRSVQKEEANRNLLLIPGQESITEIAPKKDDSIDDDDVVADDDSNNLTDSDDDADDDGGDDMMLHSDDPIEGKLQQIMEMLMTDRQQKKNRSSARRQEKKQVIFVLANYFVLFLSLIAISAEIQGRAPKWASWMETQLKNVEDCAKDQDALFECVSNGDIAGLIASVILWLSRSVATKRIFLFGFETTNKLWTVVYESFVTALCWGVSYMFIRRGMNPDTRHRFLQKYWKDAVYGSLAGFNATFMKQILKNLIPQEAVEDALRDRQLKILSWLPSFHY